MISETSTLKIQDRARLYNESFPNYAPLHVFKERLYGEWELGQNYKNTSDYHGAYPE
ncbi:hypothetical protein LEP1GSC087_2546 [Leptospira interrogans serovar Bataviae str. L1111]|nr:hypothetical protein LEP1GSC087_2546 [Leptospira interrogans serovar Bataviae str. L1111]